MHIYIPPDLHIYVCVYLLLYMRGSEKPDPLNSYSLGRRPPSRAPRPPEALSRFGGFKAADATGFLGAPWGIDTDIDRHVCIDVFLHINVYMYICVHVDMCICICMCICIIGEHQSEQRCLKINLHRSLYNMCIYI